jgi:hypothetical protein
MRQVTRHDIEHAIKKLNNALSVLRGEIPCKAFEGSAEAFERGTVDVTEDQLYEGAMGNACGLLVNLKACGLEDDAVDGIGNKVKP